MQIAKYILQSDNKMTDAQRKIICTELHGLLRWRDAINAQIRRCENILDDALSVGMIQTGEVLEIDRELLAIEPDAYCIKVSRRGIIHHGKNVKPRIDYLRKCDLRK